MKMENAEEIFHFLEEFSKRKPKPIPQELNDYLAYVARTGDPVYQWSLVKCLFKEKLLNVITDFYETTPSIDIPPYPNVDPFNYDTMKNSLLERLDSFTSAPFTVQRICELLTYPRKQYNRVDKFMRAVEKNILVVSTREPGVQRHIEAENGEAMEPIVNGSDNNSEYNVDVEMEDMSWKENSEPQQSSEPQPSSSDTHISVDDIEARLKAKQDAPMEIQDKVTTQYESVTPPELNVTAEDPLTETKSVIESDQAASTTVIEESKRETAETLLSEDKPKMDVEMKTEHVSESRTLIVPEIKVDDAEMTEQRLTEQVNSIKPEESNSEQTTIESKSNLDDQQSNIDESSSDSNSKEESDSKVVSDVQTSSEESSSSSDNTDGNSNSPKAVERQCDLREESGQSDSSNMEEDKEEKQSQLEEEPVKFTQNNAAAALQNDNYSISDVQSELPQPTIDEKTNQLLTEKTTEETPSEDMVETKSQDEKKKEVIDEVIQTTEVEAVNQST